LRSLVVVVVEDVAVVDDVVVGPPDPTMKVPIMGELRRGHERTFPAPNRVRSVGSSALCPPGG